MKGETLKDLIRRTAFPLNLGPGNNFSIQVHQGCMVKWITERLPRIMHMRIMHMGIMKVHQQAEEAVSANMEETAVTVDMTDPVEGMKMHQVK